MEQLLIFQLGDRHFGLEVGSIQEIVEAPPLHYIPRAPAFFLGAINFHGNILPVLDLAPILGCSAGQPDHRVIVLAPHWCPLALAVTAIHRIILPEEEQPLSASERDYVRAVLPHGEMEINLLDTAKLLASLEFDHDRRN